MPPFDRRSKTPTASRPPSGFDAPANNNSAARMPWEREDDDAFGPPAALDVTPGEAESEAKRMIYEKTHPMHEALMQNAHLDHNRAMRRYTALARRAWDPAARDLAVKPARVIGEDGLAQLAAPDLKPASAKAAPLASTTSFRPSDPPHAVKSRFETNPTDVKSKDIGKSKPQPRQEGAPDSSLIETGEQSPRPQGFSRRGHHELPPDEQVSENVLIQRDRNRSDIAVQRREQSLIAQNRGIRSEEQRTLPVPPHNIGFQEWVDAQFSVETNATLSAIEKYVHLRLFGYEGLSVDSSNPENVSVGGVRNSVLFDQVVRSNAGPALCEVLIELRRLEGKSRPEWEASNVSVSNLAVDELIDAQRIYLVRYLEGWTSAQQVHDSTILDRLGPPEMVAQIADTIFHHGPTIGTRLLQEAANKVVSTWPPELQERFELEPDGNLGSRTRGLLLTLTNGAFQEAFLLTLRQLRSEKLIADGNYAGNNRLRVWGLTAADIR